MGRQNLELKDDIFVVMSEGNPGAIDVLFQIIKKEPLGIMSVLNLDDMNIRGTQIWLGYKDYCDGNLDDFIELVSKRDETLVEAINIQAARQGTRDKAVVRGASSMGGNRPTFTDKEMYEFILRPMPQFISKEKNN